MYFNEHDKFAAEWLNNLYPDSTIDTRSIVDVQAKDLEGFDRAHLFAGIGGWQYALHLAGWPDEWPVWSGSCPCQPFSSAGKGEGQADERHLWPEMFRLVRECRPWCVIGEQVPNAIGHGWLDGVFADLEGEGYACGSVVLGAHSLASPHIRQRIFWVAISSSTERRGWPESAGQRGRAFHVADGCLADGLANDSLNGRRQGNQNERGSDSGIRAEGNGSGPANGCEHGGLADTNGPELQRVAHAWQQPEHESDGGTGGMGNAGCSPGCTEHGSDTRERSSIAAADATGTGPASEVGRLDDTTGSGRRPQGHEEQQAGRTNWSDFRIIQCSDNRARRISAQRGDEPLAYGIPRELGRTRTILEGMGYGPKEVTRMLRRPRSLLALAGKSRVGRLRGYGNAIVPEVAAVFIRSVMETLEAV